MDRLISRDAHEDTPSTDEFEKKIYAMFDSVWDCEIEHPVFNDTVGDMMRAVIQCYKKLSAQPDNQINLCDSCDYSYPDCPSKNDNVIFGNGIGNDNICACNKYKPSVQSDQEEFEWCTNCKEYDQEQHCCHRFTKVIRNTVEELKATQFERKMSNKEWIDFLVCQFDISRTSAKEMLHGMMQWKKEDNFKKQFSGR